MQTNKFQKPLENSLEFRPLPVAEKIHGENDCLAGRAGCRCRSADYIHFELINFPRLKEVTVVAALAVAIAVASATCCTFEISFAEM